MSSLLRGFPAFVPAQSTQQPNDTTMAASPDEKRGQPGILGPQFRAEMLEVPADASGVSPRGRSSVSAVRPLVSATIVEGARVLTGEPKRRVSICEPGIDNAVHVAS